MAEITAVRSDMRLVPVKGRLLVGKMFAVAGGGQAPRHHAGRKRAVGQDAPPLAMAFATKAATGRFFYQTVNFLRAGVPPLLSGPARDSGSFPPLNALQLALFTPDAVAYKQPSHGFAQPAGTVQDQTPKASKRTPQRTA